MLKIQDRSETNSYSKYYVMQCAGNKILQVNKLNEDLFLQSYSLPTHQSADNLTLYTMKD